MAKKGQKFFQRLVRVQRLRPLNFKVDVLHPQLVDQPSAADPNGQLVGNKGEKRLLAFGERPVGIHQHLHHADKLPLDLERNRENGFRVRRHQHLRRNVVIRTPRNVRRDDRCTGDNGIDARSGTLLAHRSRCKALFPFERRKLGRNQNNFLVLRTEYVH